LQSVDDARYANEKYIKAPKFIVQAGNVYDKIMEQGESEFSFSVHAFVVRATGDLVKAASWKAPQKSKTHPSGLAVRFNISDPAGFAEAVDAYRTRRFGYLYANN
jgi:hypothetical protein